MLSLLWVTAQSFPEPLLERLQLCPYLASITPLKTWPPAAVQTWRGVCPWRTPPSSPALASSLHGCHAVWCRAGMQDLGSLPPTSEGLLRHAPWRPAAPKPSPYRRRQWLGRGEAKLAWNPTSATGGLSPDLLCKHIPASLNGDQKLQVFAKF